MGEIRKEEVEVDGETYELHSKINDNGAAYSYETIMTEDTMERFLGVKACNQCGSKAVACTTRGDGELTQIRCLNCNLKFQPHPVSPAFAP